ncbi:MAG TPA: PLD nuclease N-terminal domain-containing protein [Jiangellaceae bacterium]
MVRVLPIIIAIALAVYAFVDCIQTDPAEIRGPRRSIWIAIIVLVPVIGPAAWLLSKSRFLHDLGRRRPHRTAPAVAPDDNPEFLRQIRDIDEQHKEMLTQWEQDLRRREKEMRERGNDDGDDGSSGHPAS